MNVQCFRDQVKAMLADLSEVEPDVHDQVRAACAAGARLRLVVDFLDDGETLVRVRVINPQRRNWWASAVRYRRQQPKPPGIGTSTDL